MTRVKICGITNLRDLKIVLGQGTDAIGVITGIPSSARNVPPDVAKSLIEKTPIFTKSVLVTSPKSLNEAINLCKYLKPDAIQIYENIDLRKLSSAVPNIDIIKPFSVNFSSLENLTLNDINLFDAILFDTSTKTKLGGTGKIHDWEISKKIAQIIKPKPIILAGGLDSNNIMEAIRRVKPYAVDVCTGTEASPGIKDPKKIEQFISKVHEANRKYSN
jgi:phosphoribosylanthranilate isomerase